MTFVIARQMFVAEVLKLRRNRGLIALSLVLSVGLLVVFFGYNAIEHASNPAQNGPAGGVTGFNRGVQALGIYFGALTAILIGTEAGTADISSGVFRDLVATGRSRLALFFVRAPAALLVTVLCTGAGFLVTLICTFLLSGGTPTPSLSLILQSAGWIVLANIMLVSLAVGVGSLTGSRAATLTAVIGWQAVATPLLRGITTLGSARNLLLTVSLSKVSPVSHPDILMTTGAALAVLAGWFLIPTLAGASRTQTQDA